MNPGSTFSSHASCMMTKMMKINGEQTEFIEAPHIVFYLILRIFPVLRSAEMSNKLKPSFKKSNRVHRPPPRESLIQWDYRYKFPESITGSEHEKELISFLRSRLNSTIMPEILLRFITKIDYPGYNIFFNLRKKKRQCTAESLRFLVFFFYSIFFSYRTYL